MNENKASEEELFVDDIGEDFDFGEDLETVQTKSEPPSPRGPNKIILLIALLLIIGGAGYFGYKYFYTGSNQISLPSTASLISPAEKTTPKTPVTSSIPTKEQSKREPIKTDTKTATTLPQKVPGTPTPGALGTAGTPSKEDSSFTESEIAKAFSAADIKPPVPKQAVESKTSPQSTAPSPNIGDENKTDGTFVQKAGIQPKEATNLSASTSPSGTSPTIKSMQGDQAQTIVPTPRATDPTSMPIKTAPTSASTTQAQSASTQAQKDTIQELQKDLFTPPPEKPKHTPIGQSAQTIVQTPSKSLEHDQVMQRTMDTLSKMNQQMENNLNQVKYLEAYTREISETVAKLNSQISAMDNRILALTNTANSLSKDVGNVRTEVGSVKQALGEEGLYIEPVPSIPSPKQAIGALAVVPKDQEVIVSTTPQRCKIQDTVVITEPEYTLHAVIPGRAWLKTATGQIITVTENDAVGNYGKVLVIDAANGVVLTSTGVTFR